MYVCVCVTFTLLLASALCSQQSVTSARDLCLHLPARVSNFTLTMTEKKQRFLLNSGYKIGTKQRVLLVERLTIYFLSSVVKTFQ